jgi:hypothetical protein
MKYFLIGLLFISSLCRAQFINNTGISVVNSASLTINGDWQNAGSFRNNGVITTSEDWVNTGTLDVNSSGGFVLQFVADHNFSAGSNSAHAGFLAKTGTGNALLSGKLFLRDSLRITQGLIKAVTANDTLSVQPVTLIKLGAGSYVEGPMAGKAAGTVLLPMGMDGYYLPIKFFNVTSTRVGASLEAAPVGYIKGDALESVSSFPYAWRTVEYLSADTARYIEVRIPDGLATTITNPILVKKLSGQNVFEGMGSRVVSSDGTMTTIRSYSNGLKGLFSLGEGYAGGTETDSLELINFFSASNGNSWINRNNWNTGRLADWFGITEKGGRIIAINMPSNGVTGTVPASIVSLLALKTFNISSNAVTSVPDFTAMPVLSVFNVASNNLDFGSLESNAAIIGDVRYENQAAVTPSSYNEIPVGSDTLMTIPIAGSANVYQWKFKQAALPGAISNSYNINSISRATMGDYQLEITNPLVPGLTLVSGIHSVAATATISGELHTSNAQPAASGDMYLLRITSSDGFDTVRVQSIQPNGSFVLKNIVLNDYVLNGFPDTLLYPDAIPTWKEATIFWEEADTIFLNDNLSGLVITAEEKPVPPVTDQGVITGTFYETVPDEAGKLLGKERVAKAPVTVRRVERAGRTTETLTLVAYIFTNDEGKFTFDKLDEGEEYRLNIQYPGYPMDTNTFVTIPLGTTWFDRYVAVEAEIINQKIKVRQLVITGWEEENHTLTAYPNPTADYVIISDPAGHSILTFEMNDITGAEIPVQANWSESEKHWKLDLKYTNKGMYFLRIKRKSETQTLRILIE